MRTESDKRKTGNDDVVSVMVRVPRSLHGELALEAKAECRKLGPHLLKLVMEERSRRASAGKRPMKKGIAAAAEGNAK